MSEHERMQDRLVFLIGSPRSGSTLLARMLGAHSQVFAPPEPHLMPPLAHLGFFGERVERAPYDPVITQHGLEALTALLPRGEEDVRDALRAATDTLYGRALAPTGRRLFLDKTPAYALVLPFLTRLYPQARYVVLTRHPLAVWSSYVDSFFAGDHRTAHAHNPVLERYVPAVARLLRERPVPLVHVRYEELVAEPEKGLRTLCHFLGLAFEPGTGRPGHRGTGVAPHHALGLEVAGDPPGGPGPAAAGARDPGAPPRPGPGELGLRARRPARGGGGARAHRRPPLPGAAHALRAGAAPARAPAPKHPRQRPGPARAPGPDRLRRPAALSPPPPAGRRPAVLYDRAWTVSPWTPPARPTRRRRRRGGSRRPSR